MKYTTPSVPSIFESNKKYEKLIHKVLHTGQVYTTFPIFLRTHSLLTRAHARGTHAKIMPGAVKTLHHVYESPATINALLSMLIIHSACSSIV